MKINNKRIMAIIMSVMMIATLIPMSVFAADESNVTEETAAPADEMNVTEESVSEEEMEVQANTNDIGMADVYGVRNVVFTSSSTPELHKQIEENIEVVLNDETLTDGVDYIISYGDLTKVGKTYIKFEGIGDYEGTKTEDYYIIKKDVPGTKITAKNIYLKTTHYVYDGKLKKPAVTVIVNGKTLRNKIDYELTYSGNRNAGTAYAIVEGRGKYTSIAEKPFTISKAPQVISVNVSSTKLNKGSVATITQTKASGNVNIGVFTYKSSNTSVLKVERDKAHNCKVYAVGKGTATVTIQAGSTKNYKSATKVVKFTVSSSGQKITITKSMVTISPTTVKLTKPITYPKITVTYKGRTLVYGQDYRYWITNEKKPGKANVKLWGIGNYTGTVNLQYTVRR